MNGYPQDPTLPPTSRPDDDEVECCAEAFKRGYNLGHQEGYKKGMKACQIELAELLCNCDRPELEKTLSEAKDGQKLKPWKRRLTEWEEKFKQLKQRPSTGGQAGASAGGAITRPGG